MMKNDYKPIPSYDDLEKIKAFAYDTEVGNRELNVALAHYLRNSGEQNPAEYIAQWAAAQYCSPGVAAIRKAFPLTGQRRILDGMSGYCAPHVQVPSLPNDKECGDGA